MSGQVVPELDAAQRAALSAGKPLVCECPPAWWFVQPVFDAMHVEDKPGLHVVIVVPQIEDHDDVVRVVGGNVSFTPVHLSTGLTRTKSLLRRNAITTLVTTPTDVAALIGQSAIQPESVSHIVLAWPELYDPTDLTPVQETLAELRSAQRIIVSSNLQAVTDLVERYARRAPVYRNGVPEAPLHTTVRYVVVPGSRREAALRAALDIFDPDTTTVWDPAGAVWSLPGIDEEVPENRPLGLAVFMDLPAPGMLAETVSRAKTTLVFVRPTQCGFLRHLAVKTTAVKLPSGADRARDRSSVVRAELRERLEAGTPMGILTTLEPLLGEFDPVEIAAAALMGTWQDRPKPEPATWTRIRADIGKRDNVRVADLVGALVNAVGIQPGEIGRIDLRDSFAIIEVRPEDATKVTQGLTGTTIRGKRLTARLDDVRRALSPKGRKPSRSMRPSKPDRA